ncbi:MAG: asparagine synthase (glutamine-hydrolyzing), partial [Anaerolineae bacterium]
RLFCSRDRFGVKPFYYIYTRDRFAFASEPKALWASGLVQARPNPTLLIDFLAGYEASQLDETLFEGIQQLPGGHNLIVTASDFQIRRYWSLPCNTDLGPAQPDDAPIQRLRELLIDAVRLRLRSDVPVGTCLSGGLDSSAIVRIANDLMQHEHNIPRALVGDHQKTFTACYDDAASDERAFAQRVVDVTGAEWHQTFPTAESLRADLDRFIWHHDEPPVTTSMYAQWCVMRLARQQGVIVTLDGQGADEQLGGYLPFDVYLSQIARAGQIGRFVWEIRAMTNVGSRPWRDVLLRVVANQLPAGLHSQAQMLRRDRMLGLRRGAAKAAIARHQRAFDSNSRTNLPRHLYALSIHNLPRLLRSEDRNSMAFSVEARTPFLDVRLAEHIGQLPAAYRIHAGWSKYALRRAVSGSLPEAICWRRDKKGFVTPERAWLRALQPLLIDLFHDTPRTASVLDVTVVRSTINRDDFPNNSAIGAAAWRWAAAEVWLRTIER